MVWQHKQLGACDYADCRDGLSYCVLRRKEAQKYQITGVLSRRRRDNYEKVNYKLEYGTDKNNLWKGRREKIKDIQ